MIDAKTCINDAQEKMDMAVMYLEEALAHIRAGKASTGCWTAFVLTLMEAWFPSVM